MGASLVVEGSTNGTVFETYLEEVLLPTLKRGQVVVMDNLSAHKAVHRMSRASLNTVATGQWFNLYDRRFRPEAPWK